MDGDAARAVPAGEETPDDRRRPARGADGAEGPALGLALSGGGVRAALFALGVVIGLVETGLHRRVRCIASVSGGSILNAALAHVRRLGSFATVEAFEEVASRLATSLASRGTFAFDWRSIGAALWYLARAVGRSILPVAVGLAFLADKLRDELGFDVAALDYGAVSWRLVGWLTLAWAVVSILLSRGLLQEAKYRSVLRAVTASGGGLVKARLYVRHWGASGEGEAPEIMHVLVATDLLSGQPMYFSRRFVHCRPYGWSAPGDLRTAEALYSSAAFPAVFPPKKLRLGRLDFQNGEMAGPLPRLVRLADGGVYNNLGTDWFDVLGRQAPEADASLWPFGELEVDPPAVDPDHLVIVNASAPSRPVDRLGPFPLARIMSVLYDNTVLPRVDSIRAENRPLIDILDSPKRLAQRLEGLGGEAGRRAAALAARLARKPEHFWAEFSRDTAGTRTKLSRAGRRAGARLMLHGYLSSLVLLHVRFAAPLPDPLRGEEYFLSLIPRPWSLGRWLSAPTDAAPGAAAGTETPSDG